MSCSNDNAVNLTLRLDVTLASGSIIRPGHLIRTKYGRPSKDAKRNTVHKLVYKGDIAPSVDIYIIYNLGGIPEQFNFKGCIFYIDKC